MKHLKNATVTVEFTLEEARILQCLLVMVHETDPIGAVHHNLGCNIQDVVDTKNDLEKILSRAI